MKMRLYFVLFYFLCVIITKVYQNNIPEFMSPVTSHRRLFMNYNKENEYG